MKKNKKHLLLRQAILLFGVFSMGLFFTACEEDEPEPTPDQPVASFQYAISDDNFLEVNFTNFSQNAETYSWDFGDGNTSTEENPVHVYDEAGTYTVTLTAANSAGTSDFSETIEINDPNAQLAILAGDESRTWKLHRVGTSMGVGPDAEGARSYWALENDGSRPCVYYHEFTFTREGEFLFEDQGLFWGEEAIFGEDQSQRGTCFTAEAANMVNSEGDDISAWLGGTPHQYEYDPSANEITLNGTGAWMGMPQLGTNSESIVPEDTRTFNAVLEEHDGYDLLIISYPYEDLYWDFTYASYDDPAAEPAVIEEEQPFGEDLEDITPDEILVTFASRDAADLVTIDTVASGSSVVFGVEDPLDATADPVGQFIRTEGVEYQELQFRSAPEPRDIQFDNFITASIEIYIPDDTDFTTLARHMVFGFADMSQTQEWWGSPTQFIFEGDDVILGEWHTYTFDLTADVRAREDLDMIFLGIGGGGHEVGATFYVRNLIFE